MDAIANAFNVLRLDGFAAPDRWQPIYRSGLVQAFEARRFDEAAELAVFAANALDSQGRFQAALDELDFALSQASISPDATVDLLATKALFRAISGSRACVELLGDALSLRDAVRRPSAILSLDTHAAMVDLILLKPNSGSSARAAATVAREARTDSHAFALEVLAIPFLAASGDVRSARPWAFAVLAATTALRATYRGADAAALSIGLGMYDQLLEPDLEPVVRVPRNTHAAFRARTSAVRGALLRGNTAGAKSEVAELVSGLSPSWTGLQGICPRRSRPRC